MYYSIVLCKRLLHFIQPTGYSELWTLNLQNKTPPMLFPKTFFQLTRHAQTLEQFCFAYAYLQSKTSTESFASTHHRPHPLLTLTYTGCEQIQPIMITDAVYTGWIQCMFSFWHTPSAWVCRQEDKSPLNQSSLISHAVLILWAVWHHVTCNISAPSAIFFTLEQL